MKREGMKEMGSNKKEKGIFCILSPALQKTWQKKTLEVYDFSGISLFCPKCSSKGKLGRYLRKKP